MDTLLCQDQPPQQPSENPDLLPQQIFDNLNSPASISPSLDRSNGAPVPFDDSNPPAVQRCEGDDFHEPMLQYINRLLMEEVNEHINCMPHESIAYQDTVKSFSDILNEHGSSTTFSYGEEFMVSEQDFHSSSTAEGIDKQNELCVDQMSDGHLKTVSQTSSKPRDTKFCLRQGRNSPVSPPLGPQGILDLGSESHRCADCVPRNTNGNSKHYVSSASFKHQFSNGTLNQQNLNGNLRSPDSHESWNKRMLNQSLRPPVSYSMIHHASNSPSDGFISMPGMPTSSISISPDQLTKSYYPLKVFTEEPIQSSANPKMSFNNLQVSTSCTRLKRPSPEESNSNENCTGKSQEDSVSFVKNENLMAETYVEAINEGLTEIVERLKKMGPITSVAPKSHKSSVHKLATTADLKNMLLSCAQAVGDGNTRRANEILKEIRQEATPYGDDLQRLCHYFAEGLVARITGTGAILYTALSNNLPSTSRMLKAHRMLVDVSPFHKLSNIFANRRIVEAAKNACRLHIIDYGIWYGIQWPSLISALAERKGGPPFLRITMIEFPDPGNNPAGRVEWTGKKLSEYARAYGVPFEYQAIADKWENITGSAVGLRDEEILVVYSMFRLCRVLDESIMPSDPRTTILKNILEMNPKIFVHGVVHGSYTSPFFMPRFRETLSSYASMFDMMEAIAPRNCQDRLMFEREFLGREIINIVACEGQERVERPITYKQWQSKMQSLGFVQMFLDEQVVKDAGFIVRLHHNKNFNVDIDGNWLMVGWKGKILKAMTLWRPE